MSHLFKKLSRSGSLLVASLLMLGAFAQAAEGPAFSGYVDTTYSYNFNKPVSRTTGYRSFDSKTDTFLLNAAQLNVKGSASDAIGYVAKLAFGNDPSVYRAGNSGTSDYFDVQEAFVTYQCSITSIQFKAGKFVTFEGIEVIDSNANFNVTRGFLFGLAEPYTHVGAMAGYQFPKVADLWVGVVNGWDNYADNNSGKTLIAKLGLNFGDLVSGAISMSHGPESNNTTLTQRSSFDATFTVKPMEKLAVALQANAGEEDGGSVNVTNAGSAAHWYGFGVQPKVTITDKFSIGSRYEWFSDLDGVRGGSSVSQVLQNISLTPTVMLSDSLMFRVEYRYDWSSARNTFEFSNGFTNSHASTITTQLIYTF